MPHARPYRIVARPVELLINKAFDACQILHWTAEFTGIYKLAQRAVLAFSHITSPKASDEIINLVALIGGNPGCELIEIERAMALAVLDQVMARDTEDKEMADFSMETAISELRGYLKIYFGKIPEDFDEKFSKPISRH
jgi:hypothetical protein